MTNHSPECKIVAYTETPESLEQFPVYACKCPPTAEHLRHKAEGKWVRDNMELGDEK